MWKIKKKQLFKNKNKSKLLRYWAFKNKDESQGTIHIICKLLWGLCWKRNEIGSLCWFWQDFSFLNYYSDIFCAIKLISVSWRYLLLESAPDTHPSLPNPLNIQNFSQNFM